MTKLIQGAGGSSKQKSQNSFANAFQQPPANQVVEPYRPTEQGDDISSSSYAYILDLIGEGEIYGLENSYQSIYLDDTPLQNADGSFNFSKVQIETRNGTQNQTSIAGFTDTQRENAVNLEMLPNQPHVRQITSTIVNSLRITLSLPALQYQNENGDIVGTSVQVKVEIQYNGGSYATVVSDTISGKSSSNFQRDYKIPISGAFPVNIRVTRLSPSPTTVRLQNQTYWTSYTEINDSKLRYPNSALVALKFNAQNFSSIPTRSYLVRGIKVEIPNNGTVDTSTYPGRITYSGVWGGTFAAAQWTSDPAWCLWDLLTDSRYGCNISATTLDKFSFYAISQYCNELLPNGFGALEPRFGCNINIQTEEEAFNLIEEMTSIFRGMAWWAAGSVALSADRPADTSYVFSPANVIEGTFNYEGSSLKSRHTVCIVQYMDMDKRDVSYEYVEDAAAVAKYGLVISQITAFACNSRAQARRVGEWLLYTEQNECETISFSAALEAGIIVRPGMVIEVADPLRAGSRRGGRINAATTTTVTIDDDISLPTSSPKLSVILPDGTIEERSVTGKTGRVFTVAPAYSQAPQASGVWILQSSDLETSTWRVVSVTEEEPSIYKISAIAYAAGKFDYIERSIPFEQRDVTNLIEQPDAPSGVTISENLYQSGAVVLIRVNVSFTPVNRARGYIVSYRAAQDNWVTMPETSAPAIELGDAKAGLYEFRIQAISTLGVLSVVTESNYIVIGKTQPPANITGLYLNVINEQSSELSWDLHPDLDVRVGGKILIRHSPATSAAEWANATTIVPAVTGNQTKKVLPFLAGTYLVRAEDSDGNLSAAATAFIASAQLQPQPTFVVRVASSPAGDATLTMAEDLTVPPFGGAATNMFYSADLDGLTLSVANLWDSVTGNVDDYGNIDGVGGVVSTGEYAFANTIDLSGVYELNLRKRILTRAYNPGTLWDTYGLVDDLQTIDDVSGEPDAQFKFRYSSNGSDYSDWIPFESNLVRARTLQFKIVAISPNQRENIVIEELGMTALFQQNSQTAGPISSGAASYSVTFAKPFYGSPQVVITALNMVSGDYTTIDSITRTGFQVTFRNSGGTAVSRNFHYTAIGYGQEIV